MDRRPDRLTTATHPDDVADADLLHRYTASGSPDAFATLVDRYLPLVYSAAVRQTHDPHLAEDVAQATLLLLSQRAARIDPAHLPGWLLKAAHYAARNAIRRQARRRAHERRAAALRPESAPPAAADADAVSDVLDPALARLGDADRTAVVLRYLQDKSFADIAAHLRTTEAAAQRRVSRAVEKLRAILSRYGTATTPASLPAALTAAQASHPVPPSFTAYVASSATLKTASTSLLAKGALSAMAAAKLKSAAAIAAAVLLVGVAVPTTYHFAAANRDFIPQPPAPATAPFMRPVSGSLAPGMEVEPFAVMRLADKKWFGPDGRERTDVPAAISQLVTGPAAPGATHALCYRMGTSGPTTSTGWTATYRGATANYKGSYREPATRDYYFLVVLIPDPGSHSITLTIDATDRRDAAVVVVPASATAPVQGTIDGLPITAGPPTEVGGKTRLPVQLAPDVPNRGIQNVDAVNSAGKRAYPALINIFDRSRGYTFDGPPSAYREFRVLNRPFNYHATYAPVPLPQAK